MVATSYLLGVSTRRVEKLAASLGVQGLSKSQVSSMAAELDDMVEGFRSRPLDAGPYTFCWIDALTQKVREGGRSRLGCGGEVFDVAAGSADVFRAVGIAVSLVAGDD